MKRINQIMIGLALCAGVMASCKDDDEPGIAGGISLDKESIAVAAEGGTEAIAVTTGSGWVASSSQPWVSISPANGLGSADCTLAIDSTLENGSREAQIRFSAEGYEAKTVTVTQMGFYKQILLKEPEMEIESSAVYDERYLEAVITTNVAFDIDPVVDYSFLEFDDVTSLPAEDQDAAQDAIASGEQSDWLELPAANDLPDMTEVLDRKARPRTVKLKIRWNMNVVPFTRVAKIRFVAKNADDQLQDNDGNAVDAFVLTVKQKAATKITDDRAGDSIAIITIGEKIGTMAQVDGSDRMTNWSNVVLWEATDDEIKEGKVPREAVGRVREVSFSMINMADGETFPSEVKYLKYLEAFSVQSNENSQIRKVSLGEEICGLQYLKHLNVYAYGLAELPHNFVKLGDNQTTGIGLETLALSGNNFSSLPELTTVINQANFPYLKSFSLNSNRRAMSLVDLRNASEAITADRDNIGLRVQLDNATDKAAFLELLTWENLQNLQLSYNFIEGTLPTDQEMEAALTNRGYPLHYDADDFYTPVAGSANAEYLDKLPNDTCAWLNPNEAASNREIEYTTTQGTAYSFKVKGTDVLRVLPHLRHFTINLNFLTGELPKWLLVHPFFAEWGPESLIFNQQESGFDSKGQSVKFDNVDAVKFDYGYYYGNEDQVDLPNPTCAYPLYYRRYRVNSSN